MPNVGDIIGDDYPTLMPSYVDVADIQEAFKMYHYGLTDYEPGDTIPDDSIEGHFRSINEDFTNLSVFVDSIEVRVFDLEGRPTSATAASLTELWYLGT